MPSEPELDAAQLVGTLQIFSLMLELGCGCSPPSFKDETAEGSAYPFLF